MPLRRGLVHVHPGVTHRVELTLRGIEFAFRGLPRAARCLRYCYRQHSFNHAYQRARSMQVDT